MKKKQHCFNCGEYLGEYNSYYGDIEVCGKLECVREARDCERERQESARERAENDNYSYYGGF